MIMEIFFLIIIVFIVQYYIMSWVETNSHKDIKNNLNKIYLSTISGLLVGFLYVLLYDFKKSTLSANYYIGLGVGIGLLTYAYRNQLGVNEYDWTNAMIEKQSGGILMTKSFLNSNLFDQTNPNDVAVSKLANWIVKNQQEEIELLTKINNQITTKGVFY